MKIYFMRHGQTNYNVKDLCNDKPTKRVFLTELGKEQVMETAEKLKNENIEIIFVSKLWRTKQTADIVNKYHNVSIKTDSRINDRKTGFNDSPYKEYRKAIEKDLLHTRINDGESFQDEKKRVFSFLDYLKRLSYETVLVITHEEVMKIASGYFEGLEDKEMWNMRVANCQLMKFEI